MGMFKKNADSFEGMSQNLIIPKKQNVWSYIKRKRYLYLMLIPALVYF